METPLSLLEEYVVCVCDCIFSSPLMAFEMYVSVLCDPCCSLPGAVCVEERLCVRVFPAERSVFRVAGVLFSDWWVMKMMRRRTVLNPTALPRGALGPDEITRPIRTHKPLLMTGERNRSPCVHLQRVDYFKQAAS